MFDHNGGGGVGCRACCGVHVPCILCALIAIVFLSVRMRRCALLTALVGLAVLLLFGHAHHHHRDMDYFAEGYVPSSSPSDWKKKDNNMATKKTPSPSSCPRAATPPPPGSTLVPSEPLQCADGATACSHSDDDDDDEQILVMESGSDGPYGLVIDDHCGAPRRHATTVNQRIRLEGNPDKGAASVRGGRLHRTIPIVPRSAYRDRTGQMSAYAHLR